MSKLPAKQAFLDFSAKWSGLVRWAFGACVAGESINRGWKEIPFFQTIRSQA
jgi:hypothetical protein